MNTNISTCRVDQKPVPLITEDPQCFIEVRPSDLPVRIVRVSPQLVPHQNTFCGRKVEVVSTPNNLLRRLGNPSVKQILWTYLIIPLRVSIIALGNGFACHQTCHMALDTMSTELLP